MEIKKYSQLRQFRKTSDVMLTIKSAKWCVYTEHNINMDPQSNITRLLIVFSYTRVSSTA